MQIHCPNCKAPYSLDEKEYTPGPRLVRCTQCQEKFQITIPRNDIEKKPRPPRPPKYYIKNRPCPFCGKDVPTNAIRCKYCGKFKKKAKLTIDAVRDDQASQNLVVEFNRVCPEVQLDWKGLLEKLPRKFQLDYSAALELEIGLRNKGVTLRIEEGDDIAHVVEHFKSEKIAGSKFSETIYSKITFERVLKDMDSKSSIGHELFGKIVQQRKDLLAILSVAFIPFFSLDLKNSYQLMFFPIFLGVLWAFIVFSFFGDGNVPLKTAALFFIFSATIGPLMALLGNGFMGTLLDFLPRLLFYILVVGLIEESVKILPVVKLLRGPQKGRIAVRYIDILVFSLICGIGFSATENVLYKSRIDELIGVASLYHYGGLSQFSNLHFLRTISLPILHGSWTAISGVIAFHGFTLGKFRSYTALGIASAAVIHGFYDTVNNQKITLLMLVGVSFASLLLLFSYCRYIDKMKYMEIAKNTKHDMR